MINGKIKKHSFSIVFSLSLFLILCILSGYRVGGHDYDNYIDMITFTQYGESLFSKVLLAKDPAFGFIVGLINPESKENYGQVFLTISFIAFFCKIFFVQHLPRCFIFTFLYILLFAPGLDFAAMRAMLGIMLLLVAFASMNKDRKKLFYFFSVLSVLSHVSMLLPLFLSAGFIKRIYDLNKTLVCFILFLFAAFMKPILSLFSSTAGYIEVSGSIFAFIPIFLSFISLLFLGCVVSASKQSIFCERSYRTALLIMCMSLGFAFQVVVASSRFMQIAQVLFLVTFCSVRFRKSLINIIFLFISILFFLIPIIYQNVDFDLWRSAWASIQ